MGYQAEPAPRESDMHQQKGEGWASQLWPAAGRWDHPCYWQSAQPQQKTSPRGGLHGVELNWALIQLVSRPSWKWEIWNTEHFLVKKNQHTAPLKLEIYLCHLSETMQIC